MLGISFMGMAIDIATTKVAIKKTEERIRDLKLLQRESTNPEMNRKWFNDETRLLNELSQLKSKLEEMEWI